MPGNVEAWELLTLYPSIIRRGGPPMIDYTAASWVIANEHVIDPPLMMRKFEAYITGMHHA